MHSYLTLMTTKILLLRNSRQMQCWLSILWKNLTYQKQRHASLMKTPLLVGWRERNIKVSAMGANARSGCGTLWVWYFTACASRYYLVIYLWEKETSAERIRSELRDFIFNSHSHSNQAENVITIIANYLLYTLTVFLCHILVREKAEPAIAEKYMYELAAL